MKILFVIAHIGKGGGQVTQSLRLIKEISKKHETKLLTLRCESDIVDEPCETIYAGPLKFPSGIYHLWKKLISMKEKYDVIQCLDHYYSLPAVFLSGKRPFYLRLGQSPKGDFLNRGHTFLAHFAELSLMQLYFSKGFIVNSKSLKQELRIFNPVFIPNGYIVDSYKRLKSKKQLRKELGLPQDKFLIIYTGKVLKSKNIDKMFDAINGNENLVAVIVGEKNQSFQAVQKSQKNIIFTGEVHMDQVKDYLHACDIFVFPSPKESSPNSVLEAMASKIPVICSNIPNHRELIIDGHSGLLFNTTRELKSKIVFLVKNKETGKKLSKNAFSYIKANHDIKQTAKKYIEQYKNGTKPHSK